LQRFGKFQLLELIGSGGMAEVFLAKPSDAVLSKLVALKRILPEFTDDSLFREHFQREGKIALSLRHQGIVSVHEMGIIEQQCYISMEYFPGKTLADIINQMHKLNVKTDQFDVAFIIMRVAEALNYIHHFKDYGSQREILHRDISPHNIMVGFDGAVKLIDFGIAKDTSLEFSKTKSLKGKFAYMSPEQIRHEQLTKQTDIFSLGIVLWELLTQKKLFAGKTIEEVTKKVEKCEVPSLAKIVPHVSSLLGNICKKALEEKSQNRYPNAAEMADNIQSFLKFYKKENPQAHLAEVVQVLFPEDFRSLQTRLRRYEEEAQEVEVVLNHEQTYSDVKKVSRIRNFSQKFKRKTLWQLIQSKAHFASLAAVLIAASLIIHRFIEKAAHKQTPSSATAASTQPPPPVAAPTPPPPAVTPSPAPVAVKPTPMPVAAPAPLPVAKPAPMPATQPKPIAQTPKKYEYKARPVVKPVVKRPPPPVKRKVAATPPSLGYAYITVLSEPNSRILVNGKFVGQDVTPEIKVPAGKNIKVETISKTTGITKSKTFTFKPSSRHVIEMFEPAPAQ